MTLLLSLVAMFGISTVATVAWIIVAPKEDQETQQPVRTRSTDWAGRRVMTAE